MPTTYTKIAKASGTSYTKLSPPGDRYGYAVYGTGVYGNNGAIYTKVSNLALGVISSLSESNRDGLSNLRSNSNAYRVAQTFTTTAPYILDSAKWYLQKVGSPTGNSYAKIYATSAGAPTGNALATSDAYVVSPLSTTSFTLVTFNFTDTNRIRLASGTTYAISFEPDDLTAGTNLQFGTDTTSPAHPGTEYIYNGSAWASQTPDAIHYVYGGVITQYTNIVKAT